MSYQDENNKLLESFLNRTFFKSWADRSNPDYTNFAGLELYINTVCNLGCKYCYITRYGDELYPPNLYQDNEKIIKNTNILLDWLLEKKYYPYFEIFSGEPLVQDISYRVLDIVLDKIGEKTDKILIPTNYTFLLSDALTERVEKMLEKAKKVGTHVSLSASFDGKYCEGNRPFKHTIKSGKMNEKREWIWEYNDLPDKRDDEYYDKCFAFAKKYNFGFHPMIYSDHIEDWKDNFLWFQKMFEKHGIPWWNVYLLEVRNIEWSEKQINGFGDFVSFLIKWTWDRVGRNINSYMDFMFKGKGFNILSSPLSTIGRGLGCSLQSNMYVRLGNLSFVPCHRQSYNSFVGGRFKVENDEIVGIIAENPELFIGEISSSLQSFPYCEQCILNSCCSGGCLGSQFETTGDPFTPIPTVCQLEHKKIESMIKTYKELGIYDVIYGRINEKKKVTFDFISKIGGM